MSKREDIASNIITVLTAVTSPITLKKITREPFNVDELSEQQYPACFVQSGNETRTDQTISFSKSIPHPVIASGGVSSIKDIIDLSKQVTNGIEGVVIGRALYDKKFTFCDAMKCLRVVT